MASPRRRTIRALALLVALIALGLLSSTPVAAADVDTGELVAAFEAQGMDCQSNETMWLCSLNEECEFIPDGYSCSYLTDSDRVAVATIQQAFEPQEPPFIDVRATQTPARGRGPWAAGLFLAAVDVACPEVHDEVEAWLEDFTDDTVFHGDVTDAGTSCQVTMAHFPGSSVEDFQMSFGFSSMPVFSFPPLPSAVPSQDLQPAASGTAATPAAPSASEVAAPGISTGSASGGDEAPAAGAPGEFLRSIPAPDEVSADPAVMLQSALLALAVVFLMPFPAQLFNSTVESNAEEIRGWFAPVVRPFRGVGRGVDAFWRTPLGIVVFLAGSAVLYALLDPDLQISLASLQTLVALAAGIVVVTLLFSLPVVLAHRQIGDRPAIAALPGTLLVGAACVAVSRLADFQPGYLYGLVIGIAFAQELDPRSEGRSGAVAALLMLAASVAAWIGLGLLEGAVGFLPVLLQTVLAAVMVAGLEGVVFGLMPLRFLPGEPVYRWNRVVWGALLLIGLFAFFHILVNPSSGYLADGSRTPLVTIVALLVGFGALSVGLWAYFRYRRPSAADELPLAEADTSD